MAPPSVAVMSRLSYSTQSGSSGSPPGGGASPSAKWWTVHCAAKSGSVYGVTGSARTPDTAPRTIARTGSAARLTDHLHAGRQFAAGDKSSGPQARVKPRAPEKARNLWGLWLACGRETRWLAAAARDRRPCRSVEEARPALGLPGSRQHARQEHAELAADAGLAAGRDLAAEEPHAASDERQADAQAVVAARRRAVSLREQVEDLLQTLGRDADAGVAHRDGDRVPLTGADRDQDLTARRELEGVADQVEEDPAHEVAVDLDARGPGVDVDPHLHLLGLRMTGDHRQHLLEQPLGTHPLGAHEDAVGLELHEEEDVVDERIQVSRAAEHAVEEARMLVAHRPAHPFSHEGGIAEDRVQRGAQLVRDHAEELRLHAVRAAELVGQPGDALLARAQRLVLGGGHPAAEAELALELAAQPFDRLAAAGRAERLADDLGHQGERVAAGEGLGRRGDGVQHERPARVAGDGERQHEEPFVRELGRGDGDDAAVRHAAEARRLDAGPEELRQQKPAALVEIARAATQPLRLRREARERELALGPVGEHDGAGLEPELAHQDLGDLLPAHPQTVAARQHAEHELDGREVEDGVVPLLLDLGEGAARPLVRHPLSALRPAECLERAVLGTGGDHRLPELGRHTAGCLALERSRRLRAKTSRRDIRHGPAPARPRDP